jgi:hypothetical protein
MRTVLLYIRTDLAQLRYRVQSSSSARASNGMCVKMTELIRGVISTIDDVVATGTVTWNALFLMHLIHAFTMHLYNIDELHGLAGDDIFLLNSDHTRVVCNVRTLLSVCQACLDGLCSRPGQPSQGRVRGVAAPPVMVMRARSVTHIATPPLSTVLRRVDSLKACGRTVPSGKLNLTTKKKTTALRRFSTSSTDPAESSPPRLDPYVQMQLTQLHQLARKFTSRDLMGARVVAAKHLNAK